MHGTRALALFATALIAGCTSTPEAPKHAEIHQEIEVEATVTAVDRTTREIALTRTDGVRFQVVAGPEVRNFDRIDVGDTLKGRYVQSLSARLLGPDEADTAFEVGLAAARAEIGQDPAGGIAAGVAQTVRIESVDKDTHTVVFAGPTGTLQVVRARREEGRKFVSGLKPGDHVELIWGESVVLTVE